MFFGTEVVYRQSAASLPPVRLVTALAVMFLLVASSTNAASTQEAVAVVESSIARIDSVLTSDLPAEQVADGLELLFRDHIDAVYMARAVLGPPWRKATPTQRQAFAVVFRRYLAEKYSRYFPKFIGLTYKVVRARTTRNDATFEIVTKMYLRHQAPAQVHWHLAATDGTPKIRNMIVEDWNLLVLEKAVVRSLLSQNGGSLSRLIRSLPRRYSQH